MSLVQCEHVFDSPLCLCLLLTGVPFLCAYLSTFYSFLFFSFLATTHRRNDPKTLSCQDRALPSGIVLAGSGERGVT